MSKLIFIGKILAGIALAWIFVALFLSIGK